MEYSPKDVAALLGIALATLNVWRSVFFGLLSDTAQQERAAQQRYTMADVAVLRRAQVLLRSGRTLEQTRRELAGEPFGAASRGLERSVGPIDRSTVQLVPLDDPPDQPTVPLVPDDSVEGAGYQIGLADQARRGPIDQLRDYLRAAPAEEEPPKLKEPWRENYTGRVFYWLGLLSAVGLMAILIGFGVVLVSERSPLKSVGRSDATATPALAPTVLGRIAPPEDQTAPSPAPATVVASPIATAAGGTAPTTPSSTPPSPTTQPPTAAARQLAATALSNQLAGSPSALTPSLRAATPTAEGPTATTGPLSATAVLQQVAAAEAALRSGQFEATIDYGGGNRSSAQAHFDMGGPGRVPQFHITSTYTGTNGTQTVERITIGNQSWERQTDGRWTERLAQEGVIDQLRVFLPHADAIANAELTNDAGAAVLRWYDAGRDVDVTLLIDPVGGTPRELRQVTRATGVTLVVTYRGWNTPVEVKPPEEN